jgi:sulfide:quinone oxidoreductase
VTVVDPGEPVLHGRLLVGQRTRRLRGRGDAEGAPLWWPHGKVAGEFLPRWLAENGVAPPASEPPPEGEGITVERSQRALRAPEYQYLFELGREYRTDDPAIASLGRRMREARSR